MKMKSIGISFSYSSGCSWGLFMPPGAALLDVEYYVVLEPHNPCMRAFSALK